MSSNLRSLTQIVTLATTLATAAAAQVPGSLHGIAPLLGYNGGANSVVFANGLQAVPLDGAFNPSGIQPNTGASLFFGDQITSLGGNNYRLTLTIQGFGNLVPQGYPYNGIATDHFGMAIGNQLGSSIGYPIEFDGSEAAFVSVMDFNVYDFNDNLLWGPIDVRSAADLNDPDAGGGWGGNVAFLAPQSNISGSVGKLELIIDYRIGLPNDFQTWPGSGCTPAPWETTPILEMASAAVTGEVLAIGAGNVPNQNLGLWLMIGETVTNPISLSVLGADPNCMLWMTGNYVAAYMPVDPFGVYDNRLTFVVPQNPALAGAVFGMQTIGIYGSPGPLYNGFYVGDYAEVTIGG